MAKSQISDVEMLSAGKLAEKIGATPAKVKKAITELKIEPAMTKCNCNYYSPDSVMKIKEFLG